MNILWRLSARHLALNKKRTAITVIGIALSVAMVTAISGMIVSFQDLLYRDSVAREGLWHVRYFELSEESAKEVAGEPVFSVHETYVDDEGRSVLQLQFAKLGQRIFEDSETICARYGIQAKNVQYHNNLLIAKGILPGNYYETLYRFAAVLLTLVAAGSVMVISNAFSISASERSHQFGLLASAGATRAQIRDIVLLEGVTLALFGIPLGILGGYFAEWVALSIANNLIMDTPSVRFLASFRVVLSPVTLLVAAAAAVITIFLSAWFPARRASRVSPIDAIRRTAEIKIRPRSVRISPLIGRLFGFEGVLAAKTMKRSRGKYRTTVLSLVVSIVLFVGVSSFGDILTKATSMAYEDFGSNVLITLFGEDKARQDRLTETIGRWEDVAIYPHRYITGATEIPQEMLTAEVRETMVSGTRTACLYSLSDDAFQALCADLGIDPAAMENVQSPSAILINATGTYIQEGQRYSYTPFRFDAGDVIPVEIDGTSTALTLAGVAKDIPLGMDVIYQSYSVNLIVSETVRAALMAEGFSDRITIPAMAVDAYGFTDRVTALLEEEMEENTWRISNYEELAATNRNFSLLVMIFIYGFVGMLSLIGVTNVITTISTGIALRRGEFAMLRSVGITQHGIVKILTYENIIYGAKALVIGLVIGNIASWLMFDAMGGSMSFAYIWPVSAMLISVAGVTVLVSATTLFAAAKQKRDNIIGALRDEVA